MKHLAAYLLLALGGNSSPSESNIKTVLESVEIEADNERLSKRFEKIAAVPFGGSGGGAPAAGGAAASGGGGAGNRTQIDSGI